MCQLIETIKISNGKAQKLAWHQQRFDTARHHFFGNDQMPIDLASHIDLTNLSQQIIYKCRIIYHRTIEKITFVPYQKKKIEYIKIVESNTINYPYKFQDRSAIHQLYQQKQEADDVIMIKNGLVTDSSYANLVFEKEGQLFTPDTPLLHGTKRAYLLKKRIVREKKIQLTDIKKYEKVHLINAMLELGEVVVGTDKIVT